MNVMLRWTRTCAVAVLLTLFACSDSGSEGEVEDLPDEVSVVVGSKGGQIKAKGVSLEIPEGALDKSVMITAKATDKPAPSDKTAISKIYEFGPAGTKFAKDVTVSFDTDKHEPQAKVFFTKEGSDKDFEQLPTDLKEKSASAKVRHFSLGFVGLASDELPPSMDASAGGDLDGGTKPTDPDDHPEAGIVTDAGAQPHRVTVLSKDVYGQLTNQTWGAYQDGDGPWVPMPLPVSQGTYEITVKSERYGVAFVCAQAGMGSYGGVIMAASTSTVQTVDAKEPCMSALPVFYQVSGTVTPPSNGYNFRWAHPFNGGGSPAPGTPTFYAIPDFPAGILTDVIVVSTDDTNVVPIKVDVLRDLAASADVAGRDIDLGTGGSAVTPATFKVDNGGSFTNIDITLTTRGVSAGGMWLNTGNVTGTPPSRGYVALTNTSVLRATDRYRFFASEDTGDHYVELELLTSTSGDLSALFPDTFTPDLSRAGGAYVRPSAIFTAVPHASAYRMYFQFTDASSETTREFTTQIEVGWFDGTPSEFTFPDLSEVTGFDGAWFPPGNRSTLDTRFGVETEGTVNGGTLRTRSEFYSDLVIPI